MLTFSPIRISSCCGMTCAFRFMSRYSESITSRVPIRHCIISSIRYEQPRPARSFCYVDDLIDGILSMMLSGKDLAGAVNLGNPGEHTILDVAEKVLRFANSRSRVRFAPFPPDDPRQRQPDLTLARTALGWQPSVTLDDGLKETIAYFRPALS